MLAQSAELCQHVFDDVAVDVGEAAFEAVVIVGQFLVVQAHQVQERGIKVVDAGFVHCGFESEFVALTVAVAFLDSGAGEKASERVGVVIAAGSVGL